MSDWHKLPRELRDLITEYGNAQYDLGAHPYVAERMPRVERVSHARDALTDYLIAHKPSEVPHES